MALTYHFVTVPQLPPELRHQLGTVEVDMYLVNEGQIVSADTPVLAIRNWWAEMEVLAGIQGYLVSTIFKSNICRGGRISPGDPIALIVCDPEVCGEILPDHIRLRVIRQLHARK